MAVKEKIEVEGNFKEQLSSFINSLKNAKNSFKDLANGIKSETKNSEQEITYFQKRVEQVSRSFIKEGNTVKDSIRKATQEVQKEQERSVDIISKKYIKLGETIQNAYAKAKKEVDIAYNGSTNNSTSGGNNSLNDFIKSFFGSSLGKGLTVLGAIQASVKTVESTFKLANNISSQTLGAINTLSGNMISSQGLKEAVSNATDFEDIKTNIMVLSKQLGFDGQKIYEDATKLAMATRFTEKDVTSNAEWMLKAGLNPDMKLMTTLSDLASLKPGLGASHAGFAVFDALAGRVTSLKTNYGIDNEALSKFQETLKGQDKKDTAEAIKKSGSGFKINDKQQYINLLELYINDRFPDLAKTQSKTLSGLFSTISGGIEQLASDLIGYETKKGEIVNGSFFDVLKNALGEIDANTGKGTGFIGWLKDLADNNSFKNLRTELGNITSEIIDTVKQINSSGVLNTLMYIGSSFLSDVTNFIKELKDTGQLNKLMSDFPELVKASLDYELAKLEALSKLEPLIPLATNFLKILTDFISFLSGKDMGENGKKASGIGRNIMNSILPGSGYIATAYGDIANKANGGNGGTLGQVENWFKELFAQNEKNMKNLSVGDITAQQWVDKYANISSKEKDQIKEMIKSDNTNTYNITFNGDSSFEDKVNLLINEIEKAQSNS